MKRQIFFVCALFLPTVFSVVYAQVWDDFNHGSDLVEAKWGFQDSDSFFPEGLHEIISRRRFLFPSAEMAESCVANESDVGTARMQIQQGALEMSFTPGTNSKSNTFSHGARQFTLNEPSGSLYYYPIFLDVTQEGFFLRIHVSNRTNIRVRIILEDTINRESAYVADLPDGGDAGYFDFSFADFEALNSGSPPDATQTNSARFTFHPRDPGKPATLKVQKIESLKQETDGEFDVVPWGPGYLLVELEVGRYYNPYLGTLESFGGGPINAGSGLYTRSLGGEVYLMNGGVFHPQYGWITPTDDFNWLLSSFMGNIHFGDDENTYDGWVFTSRFGWVKLVSSTTGGRPALYVPRMNSWMLPVAGGPYFIDFEWGRLLPIGHNTYRSSIFGTLTVGDFGGWVKSELYGWMWANGNSWFWSQSRNEWLGVTKNGRIWSTADKRFLPANL